jgi:hypothetical protein
MNFKEILDIARNIIDETDEDEQIDVILKSAINKAYIDLSSVYKRLNNSYIPIVNKIATLPDDLIGIEYISPSLDSTDKRIGKNILTSKTGTFELIYSYIREPLVNDTDEPDLDLALQYALAMYGCYKYSEYKKRDNMVQMFMQSYQNEVSNFLDRSDVQEEYIQDVYV